jgi:hypothetical protein
MSIFAFMSIFSFHYHQQYFYWTWQLVTRWVHHKKQDLITLREYIGFNPVLFGGVRVAHLFVCCVVSICFYFICLCYVSCAQCCLCVWIVHSWLLLRVSIFIYTVFISDTPIYLQVIFDISIPISWALPLCVYYWTLWRFHWFILQLDITLNWVKSYC